MKIAAYYILVLNESRISVRYSKPVQDITKTLSLSISCLKERAKFEGDIYVLTDSPEKASGIDAKIIDVSDRFVIKTDDRLWDPMQCKWFIDDFYEEYDHIIYLDSDTLMLDNRCIANYLDSDSPVKLFTHPIVDYQMWTHQLIGPEFEDIEMFDACSMFAESQFAKKIFLKCEKIALDKLHVFGEYSDMPMFNKALTQSGVDLEKARFPKELFKVFAEEGSKLDRCFYHFNGESDDKAHKMSHILERVKQSENKS
jgi:hypothetical protein